MNGHGRTATAEYDNKKKITKEGLKNVLKLFAYVKPYQLEYAAGMFFLIGASLANLAFPKLLGDLVDAGNKGTLSTVLNRLVLLLVAILVIQALFSYFRAVLFANVTEKTMADIRRFTYNHLIKLPLSFFDKHRVGELNSRISSDISMLHETFTTTLADFIRQMVVIFGGIGLLIYTSPQLTVFMLAILPVVILSIRFFGRFIRNLSRLAQKKTAESNTIVEETLQGIRSVKSYTNEFFEMKRYSNKIDEVAAAGMKAGIYRGLFSSTLIIGLFGTLVAVIWRGALLLANGQMETGELFSFVIYSGYIGGTIGGVAAVVTRMQKFIGATEDLFEIFESEQEKLSELPAVGNKILLSGRINFKNLTFAYPARPGSPVLKNINLEIEPSKVLALVGKSGAGKSTFATLLLHLYEPTSGDIIFDDNLITDLNLTTLRSQIALVPQDIFLFGGTIRENISYGKQNASDEEILDAARKANALEFIDRFKERLDTVVGERGTQLSGGQRQRIAIARAILKDPKILILDEATSSLDSESEQLVQNALEKLMKNRTSIVIAHRLSTIRNADKIVVLENGEIVETGTHEELMKISSGAYRSLNEMQFSI
ncbi:MAG: ATP-binding cassette domain-containing protein [Prolixibacteraceae bacterium]|jgi:ABC-type multidrug transport system fused ATPase/permease subunit|nr:ATP-binding cassette domain-containing protein [Prolixibacteraceae bacterium]MBT6763400.1 ATP-binding cassette domain-containing protein [Prolixibacteraceae bacterium]MBT7393424.1 ATP-binding cassette domain-containing protein [Prolixibacteraceae bacterium]